MLIISESLAQDLVSIEDAIEAVAAAFIAMAQGKARNYPVVRETVGYADAVYGVKAGGDISAPFLGLKAGGYWPHNLPRGLTNHQSSTLMFDPETGRASGLVSANYLTGVRTGAASALATRALSHADASVLGIIGTGGQSVHQLRATAKVRRLTRVHAWDTMPENVARFAAAVTALGLDYVAETSPQAVAEAAEIIITVTPSQKPILHRAGSAPAPISARWARIPRASKSLTRHLLPPRGCSWTRPRRRSASANASTPLHKE